MGIFLILFRKILVFGQPAKARATPEEILLRRNELATTYSYSASIGFSYTFGSVFSNVVNPRFGRY